MSRKGERCAWARVKDVDLLCKWACPKHPKYAAYVTPGWHEENGTPICGVCGRDLSYKWTKVRRELLKS